MMNLGIFLSACTNPAVLKVISFVLQLLDIVCFIVPIGLIVMISLDFAKNVMAAKDDDFNTNVHLVIKRIIFTFALFLVPTVVEFMLSLVSDASNNFSGEYQSCLDNLAYIEYYETLYEEKKEQEEKEWEEYLAQLNADEVFKKSVPSYTVSSGNNGSNAGSFVGSKYKMTDDELRKLAAQCIDEQGGEISGIQAEASLMANLYELQGVSKGYSSVSSYVFNGGWFHIAGNTSPSSVTSEQLDAVKSVFVLGKRTLPLYVDEHDCWDCNSSNHCSDGKRGDICSISGVTSISSIKNRKSYVQDQTVIKNVYGSTYTFYVFPTSTSDPFGYTAESRNRFKN